VQVDLSVHRAFNVAYDAARAGDGADPDWEYAPLRIPADVTGPPQHRNFRFMPSSAAGSWPAWSATWTARAVSGYAAGGVRRMLCRYSAAGLS
jgi:hypothetical protein